MLTAVLFVLKTGIAWEDLPQEAFGVSYKTCTRRIDDWTDRGIWQQIHELFLAKLRGADLLDWSRVLVDCSLVKAPLGGPKPARTRQAWCRRRIAGAKRSGIARDGIAGQSACVAVARLVSRIRSSSHFAAPQAKTALRP